MALRHGFPLLTDVLAGFRFLAVALPLDRFLLALKLLGPLAIHKVEMERADFRQM